MQISSWPSWLSWHLWPWWHTGMSYLISLNPKYAQRQWTLLSPWWFWFWFDFDFDFDFVVPPCAFSFAIEVDTIYFPNMIYTGDIRDFYITVSLQQLTSSASSTSLLPTPFRLGVGDWWWLGWRLNLNLHILCTLNCILRRIRFWGGKKLIICVQSCEVCSE